MTTLSATDHSQTTGDDEAIHWLRAHGWIISCAGGGDDWLITGYKLGRRIKGVGSSLTEALLAAFAHAQEQDAPTVN
jgi:hypothetical protein